MSALKKLLGKNQSPDEQYFDSKILECRNIFQILNDELILIDYSHDSHKYYRTYRQGRGIGGVIAHPKGVEGIKIKSEYFDVHEDVLPKLSDSEIKEIAAGRDMLNLYSMDMMLRQKLTLQQITSGMMAAVFTFDHIKPGFARVYFTRSGRFMLGQGSPFITAPNDHALAGVWLYSLQQTGNAEYITIDLRSEV